MLLKRRYRLEETLGQGGAGVVYRALDEKQQRPVAVKYLDSSPGGPDQGRERLRREAALLSRLNHPNIVGFYDMGEAAGRSYLVLEYVSGCTLRALLEAHPVPFPLEIAIHITNGVLAALTAAHHAGIVHRDLKPENIMLVDVEPGNVLDPAAVRPTVKVMDFGLAYLHDEVRITSENLVAGTALYLAPEAALGHPVDGRADLYAVGVILYEMAAGRAPFTGDDPLVVISQHLHTKPISPRWHNPKVPHTLAAIILKLLAKTPQERYPTAEAVSADLEQVQQAGGFDKVPSKLSLLESIARRQLVGRDEEMALMRAVIDAILRGHGKVVFVEGEPGTGKTRLVRETTAYARLKGVQAFTGHCYDPEHALPYQPFVEIVKAYAQANIKAGSTGYLPVSLASELVRLAPSLEAHFGGVSAPEAETSETEARLRLFEAVTTLLAGGPHPTMVILENLHRATPPDIALLQHLAQTGAHNRRLLIIVTYRRQRLQSSSGQILADLINRLNEVGLAAHLPLQPFSVDKTAAFLETLLEGPVAPEFSYAIFTITEGNPYFIEEILKALIEEGRIFRDPVRGRWEATNLESLKIPGSLKEALGRRYAKFTRSKSHVLTLAALLGRRFRVDTLIAAATSAPPPTSAGSSAAPEISEDEVLDTLAAALDMQLIRRVAAPGSSSSDADTYEFAHSLLHRALCENLEPRQQARLHRQIGTALEQLNQNQLRPVASPDELAHHFSIAGGDDTEKAIMYSLIAVENALQMHASEVAVKHYQFVLEVLEEKDRPRRAWILEQLGDLYLRRTRQILNAVAAYESAIQLWQQMPEPNVPTLLRLYGKMGEIVHHWRGHVAKLDTYLAEALHLLDQDPTQAQSLERARILTAMAFSRHAKAATGADEAEALGLAQSAAGLAVQLNAANEESAALDALQRIYRAQGNITKAHQLDQRRLELMALLSNSAEVVDANLGASHMEWETGDLAKSAKFCLEALAMAQQTDNIGGQLESLRRLVMLHLQWGKLSTAMSYAQQGVALGPRAGVLEFGRPVEAVFRAHLAILHALQGQAEAAARESAQLKGLYPSVDMPPYRSALGWIHFETEEWAEARLNLENSQIFPPPFLPPRFELVFLTEIYGHQGDTAAFNQTQPAAEAEVNRWNMPYLQAIFQRGCGVFFTSQSAWTEAEAAFKRALTATRRQAFWYQDARSWLEYGRMLARRGQPGDEALALEFLTEAQNMFTSFEAHALAEKAWIEITRLSQ